MGRAHTPESRQVPRLSGSARARRGDFSGGLAGDRPSLHTERVLRGLAAAAVLLTLGSAPDSAWAQAEQDKTPRPAKAHRPDNFWEWVANPHGEEIEMVLRKVTEIRSTISQFSGSSDVDYYYRIRKKGLEDALGMLSYALRLEPENPDLQLSCGFVAQDLGKPQLARHMLSEYLRNEIPEKIDPAAHSRLGRLEADAGNWSDAVIQLRRALASDKPLAAPGEFAQTVLCLASVYMHTGRMNEAIDLLENATGVNGRQFYLGTWDQQFLLFSLAVAYDRDEQVTRAHDVLDRLLQATAQGGRIVFLGLLSNQGYGTARFMEFTPPFDQHYFTALLYEAAGHLLEARAEWRAYARLGENAPYGERARAHVRAIDELLSKELTRPKRRTRRQP